MRYLVTRGLLMCVLTAIPLSCTMPTVGRQQTSAPDASPSAPPVPPRSRPESRPKHVVINQTISDRTWLEARRTRAERGILIYARDIDPQSDGTVDLDLLRAYITRNIPPATRGFAVLDIEVPYFRDLRRHPSSPEFQRAQREMLKALRLAKSMRPGLKWSYYGLPGIDYWHTVPGEKYKRVWSGTPEELRRSIRATATRATELLAELDFIAPTIYDFYPDAAKPTTAEQDRSHVTALVTLSRQIAGDRPVLPYVWRRYHHSGRHEVAPAYGLIPADEFTRHVRWAMDAGADGVVWWGADSYYMGLVGRPADGSFNTKVQARWKAILTEEKPPGMSIREYTDQLHQETLSLLLSAVFAERSE